jgi:hypothetical protein
MVSEESQPVHAVEGNCGQWHGKEETYITVNDWRAPTKRENN